MGRSRAASHPAVDNHNQRLVNFPITSLQIFKLYQTIIKSLKFLNFGHKNLLFPFWVIFSRGKRKRTASGAEPAENSSTAQKAVAQETGEPKGAFYHCNYCNKDISGKTRIKCVVCPDFDLCIECFSVGAELTPHKCNHPYRVMVSTFVFISKVTVLICICSVNVKRF